MARKHKPKTLTDVLKQAILDSGMTFKGLERETGVKRQSLMLFVRDQQTLRLTSADKLAAYFGLALRPTDDKATRRKGK